MFLLAGLALGILALWDHPRRRVQQLREQPDAAYGGDGPPHEHLAEAFGLQRGLRDDVLCACGVLSPGERLGR